MPVRGIGEHSASVRAAVIERLSWLGFELDSAANREHALVISTPTSRIQALVVPTNEELTIAMHSLRLVRGADGPWKEEATV